MKKYDVADAVESKFYMVENCINFAKEVLNSINNQESNPQFYKVINFSLSERIILNSEFNITADKFDKVSKYSYSLENERIIIHIFDLSSFNIENNKYDYDYLQTFCNDNQLHCIIYLLGNLTDENCLRTIFEDIAEVFILDTLMEIGIFGPFVNDDCTVGTLLYNIMYNAVNDLHDIETADFLMTYYSSYLNLLYNIVYKEKDVDFLDNDIMKQFIINDKVLSVIKLWVFHQTIGNYEYGIEVIYKYLVELAGDEDTLRRWSHGFSEE